MIEILQQGECVQDEQTRDKGLTMHYTFTSDGTLTISGQGVLGAIRGMDEAVGCSYRHSQFGNMPIRRVVVEEGITGLGAYCFSILPMTEVVLPEGLTLIGYGAFEGCDELVTINIPNSVSEIQSSAFQYCSSLEEISIPEGVTKLVSTFTHCTSLQHIDLPNSLTILNETFSNCERLTHIVIPEGVKQIKDSTFCECHSLEYISLPSTLEEIGEYVFEMCGELVAIEVNNNPRFFVENGCLCSRDGVVITGINQEHVVIPDGMKDMKIGAFSYREWIRSIVIPPSMTVIGVGSFSSSGIKKLVVPAHVEEVEFEAFANCENLEEVTFLSEKTIVDSYAFVGCPCLLSIWSRIKHNED